MTTAAVSPHTELIADELHIANRQALKQRVLDLLHDGQRRFVLDFSDCKYIDSSGLGVLVSIAKRIRDADGRLILCGLNADLDTLLELTGISSLFHTTDTRERALAALDAVETAEG